MKLATLLVGAGLHLAALAAVCVLWGVGVMDNSLGAGFLGAILGLGGGGVVGAAIAATGATTSPTPATPASSVAQQVADALHTAAQTITGGTTGAG